jgi:hypothetical protein
MLNSEQQAERLDRRTRARQRVLLALAIFAAGTAFHAYIQIHTERVFDSRFLCRLPIIALPYTIPAVTCLFTRTVLGALFFAAIALCFLAYDLSHIHKWSMTGFEAAFDIGLLWMGQLYLAIHLSIAALIFGSPRGTQHQVA